MAVKSCDLGRNDKQGLTYKLCSTNYSCKKFYNVEPCAEMASSDRCTSFAAQITAVKSFIVLSLGQK
jgi:hypothetical protein